MTLHHQLQHPLRGLFAWFALCFVLLASTVPARAADSWQAVGEAGFSAGAAESTSMALDTNNRPYVAYQDGGNSGKATVMRLNDVGTAWEVVGTAGFSADAVNFVALVLDANNRPYVAYQDGGNSGKATVMRLNDVGTAWEAVGTAGFSAYGVNFVTLALGANNQPYVAYMEMDNSGKATVMRLNDAGTAWEVVGTAGFSADMAVYPSLALGANNRPYVAYMDIDKGGNATVMRLNDVGAAWEVVGTAGFSAGAANFITLALGANDQPYVAYLDGSSGKVTVTRWNGEDWKEMGTGGFSQAGGLSVSLALDANDRPYVAYTDTSGGNKATVMRWNDVDWTAVGTAKFSANAVSFPSLAVDTHGRPAVAYSDADKSSKATVMQWRTAPSAPAAPMVTVGSTGSGQASVSWQAPADNGGSAVLSYTVTASPGGASCQVIAPATSCVITGLTMGQTYTFSVVATNAQGVSPVSAGSAAATMAALTHPQKAIPTLNAWGLTVLALALAALSALALRRRAS